MCTGVAVWLGPSKLDRPLGEVQESGGSVHQCPMLPAQALVLCFMWANQKGEKEEAGWELHRTSKEGRESIVTTPTLRYDKTHTMTQKIESKLPCTARAQPAPTLCTALPQITL